MCGLFGMMQTGQSADHSADKRWAEAMVALGILAEERGLDSSGIAWQPRAEHEAPTPAWDVTRTLRAFGELADAALVSRISGAQTVIGHTRWATQGAINLVNTSPMLVGTLLGTHNGDVDIDVLKKLIDPRLGLHGTTDTEVLFAALASAPRTILGVERVLYAATGRAAAAWTDIRRPQTVWLARAGISPLAIARSSSGALVWASNPRWLREIDDSFHLGLGEPRSMREGTVFRVTRGHGRLMVRRGPLFVPTVRAADLCVTAEMGWNKFTDRDRQHEQQCFLHRVLGSRG